MKKFNVFFALLLGAMVSFTACSKDDELTAEELEAKQTKELLETITDNFNDITSKKWTFKEFQPTAELVAAKGTDDEALMAILRSENISKLNPVLRFEEDGDFKKVHVDFNLSEDELFAKLLEAQSSMFPWAVGMDYLVFGKESFSADFRRFISAPFAADDLNTDDITSETTGLCIFNVGKSDFSKLSYDDVVLAQKKLIAGNSDKMYINEDGTLTVETTSEKFGVSKLILEEVE